jgi:predicted MPP superfamily phosphohydrolase
MAETAAAPRGTSGALGLKTRLALLGVLLGLTGLTYAWRFEPRVFLFRDDVLIDLPAFRTRVAHLSDLHIRGEMTLHDRLLEEIGRSAPDLIVISGDLIKDVPGPEGFEHNARAVAAFISQLRRIAPVYAVQGHSEHQGALVGILDQAGLEWLSNEGRLIGPGGGILLLGLNQQVGYDHLGPRYRSPFRPVEVDGARLYGANRGEPYRNFYSHYDPAPASLADVGGPLAWSGYEVTCDAWIDNEEAGVGIAVHSRYVLGEDRLIEISRDGSRWNLDEGAFGMFAHGSALTGHTSTGVRPEAKRWYRLRVRTDVEPDRLVVRSKVWPVDQEEPRDWQAVGEDRSRLRPVSGTVGLWASGGGTVAYRDLRVMDHGGRVLLDEPLSAQPQGFRVGARGTRIEMALARSPEFSPETPVVVLSHVPDVIREASRRGFAAVLAGHTHGGQVRLPLFGALTTRSSLGPYYDLGRFDFAAPNARGTTTLYINSGIGMSVLPIRFGCPPRWAIIELGN